MFTRDEARKLARRILSFSSFPECSVSLSAAEELNLRFANNAVTTSGLTAGRSIVISSTRERKTGTARTDQTDEASLRAAVKRSEELAALAPENAEHMPPLGPQEYPGIEQYDEETARARSPLLVPQVRAIIDTAVKAKLVAAGFFVRSASVNAIANKAGLFGYGRTADAELTTTVRTPDGSSSSWAGHPSVRIREIDGKALAGRAVEKCLKWRNPERLEPGRYTVVLEPAAVCNLVGLMGSSFSARGAEEGQTFLSRKGGGTLLGEKLFPEIVTLRSDPFDPRLPASPWSPGGDPVPNGRITWIGKGEVRSLFYDRYWAAKAEKQPTPWPGSFVLDGGEGSAEDLVGEVERGLLVTRLWYIRSVNPRTMQQTGLTRDGLFLIENGKVTRPVLNFRFNESPVRLLQNARRLGRPVRARSFEGGSMVAPPMLATDFLFTSISDAV